MPIENSFKNPVYQYFNGEGRWELRRDQSHWTMYFILEHGGYPVYFTTDNAAPASFYSIVDGPDSGERWVWTKSASVEVGDKR